MRRMAHGRFICCKLYISEARNATAVDAIDRASSTDPEVVVVTKFGDELYSRVRYTLVSYVVPNGFAGTPAFSPMRRVLRAMVEAAFSAIDLEAHTGAHPRVGVVDDICFHPLFQATLEDAAQLAQLVAADIGNGLQVPVFLYAAAHPTGKAGSVVRRELEYYRPNYMGNQWAGRVVPDVLPEKPDVGPTRVCGARGATLVGAMPLVDNYNVPVMTKDAVAVRRIARQVAGRGGGFPTVQALALFHGDDCTEIACLLLDPSRVGGDQVQRRVEQVAAEEGAEVEKGYCTDVSQDVMLERYIQAISAVHATAQL